MPSSKRLPVVAALALLVLPSGLLTAQGAGGPAPQVASTLPDLSGLAWIEGDLFLAVHDAKNPDELDRPRVSLVWRPDSANGIEWQPLEVAWSHSQGPSNDLESVARIPGTRSVLLVESGDDGGPFQRIFLATLASPSNTLTIDQTVDWPVPVHNVEASAVALIGDQYYFLFAERAQGESVTEVKWAPMTLSPLTFGEFRSAKHHVKWRGDGVRPIVALDVDAAGHVYAATAYDPDDDNGPFRSYASRIGVLEGHANGRVRLLPAGKNTAAAAQDGFKIEGLAVRAVPGGPLELYAGTDDENYGATMRQVRPLPLDDHSPPGLTVAGP